MKWSVRILVLAVLMVVLSACVWNLSDESQLGSLTVSISGGDGVGALDLAGFETVTFFVADAALFRQSDFSGISFPVRPVVSSDVQGISDPGGLIEGGDRSNFLIDFNPTPLAEIEFFPYSLDAEGVNDGIPIDGILGSFPQGTARVFAPSVNEGLPSSIEFTDLVVGREYVIWIDGLPGMEQPEAFGFAFARIRSGAPTTVSIDLSTDRFESFVESVYSRYIEPRVPRLDLARFSAIIYRGTGGATVSVFDTDGVPIGTEVQEYANAVVFRFEDPEYGFTVFFIAFFSEETGEEEFANLSLVLIESAGTLEPSRSTYTAPSFSYDGQMFDFVFSPGMVVGIDGLLESVFAEFDFDFYDPENAVVISQMGFTGGSPSRGGTFSATVSGPGFLEGEVSEFVDITISNMSFTFGEVIEVLDEFDFEFAFPEDGFEGQFGDLVFYLDEDGNFPWIGLEAAPADFWFELVVTAGDPPEAWDARQVAFLEFGGVTGTAIGTGQSNYDIMLNIEGEMRAAFLIDSLNQFAGGDWFLPSLQELEAMYGALYLEENVGEFTPGLYWSSSEIDAQQAWAFDFETGEAVALAKGEEALIRPVRAFGDGFVFIPPEGFP